WSCFIVTSKRGSVRPTTQKYYWKNMLEAVHIIHKHGIVHSDLKPAHFVIVNASLKLIDFGIANRIQPDVTSIMKDSQVGTLNYMPPVAKDTSSQPGKACSKISLKGDVWCSGCILYCLTYGKTPFQSITKLHAIIDPSYKIEFPDISEKDLLDVLKRCLVRKTRERISLFKGLLYYCDGLFLSTFVALSDNHTGSYQTASFCLLNRHESGIDGNLYQNVLPKMSSFSFK
uniref:Protein kinase domain-containing protein n=1 Tax=Acanthochromis polyacanthus TaxID=80966 RepID=A0A3Q1GH65_9TELE